LPSRPSLRLATPCPPLQVFSFVEGADCEEFFGTPEYVLFPTMLTSPVFTATVWQHGKRAYPSFERTLLQTRDLMVWLCVKLGLIEMEDRHELMEVMTGLANLQARMVKSKRSGAAELLRMRSSVVALVEHLQAVQKAPLPLPGSATEAELAEGIADQVHLLMQRVKGLYTEGVDKDTLAIPLDGITHECADMWRRLQDLVKPETLLEDAASMALKNLHADAAEAVLGALARTMTTSNPGSEPQNLEAKRQILFFANSLFNTTMVKPPPVSQMKCAAAAPRSASPPSRATSHRPPRSTSPRPPALPPPPPPPTVGPRVALAPGRGLASRLTTARTSRTRYSSSRATRATTSTCRTCSSRSSPTSGRTSASASACSRWWRSCPRVGRRRCSAGPLTARRCSRAPCAA